jgi:hypothetical protein
VIGFLRFIGVVNAAIWFGAAIFFTFGAGPGFFSKEMTDFVKAPLNGWAAEVIIKRYFIFQHWCGAIALLHLLAEKLYAGRVWPRLNLSLVLVLLSLGLLGEFWLQPRLHNLFLTKYSQKVTPEQRDYAVKSFGTWHGVSMAVNLIMIPGLLFYLWRVTSPKEPARLSGSRKFSVGWQ